MNLLAAKQEGFEHGKTWCNFDYGSVVRYRSGEHHGSILDSYRKATSIIEASDLDYTILRPAWLNNRDEIACGTTQKGKPFKNASEVV
jgi:hypothetical protein